ncbi:MAG: methyltransferase domain-containing protein [Gammaproteobacteria bacterium]|nr:methyltransferase domain-containing protein [Gammaproteobacteria bacterium]
MFAAELRVLGQLLRGLPGSGTHAQRLEAFYGPQAGRYDAFRERVLHGRQALVEKLALAPGERVIELGAGTGRTAEYFAERIPTLDSLTLVDLCPALLALARTRTQHWPHTQIVAADVTQYRPPAVMDKAYFSYALTMIPEWFLAIDNAIALWRPGGVLGVVDFYVSRARPTLGLRRHSAWQRTLWPAWFGHDGVNLSADHLPYLCARSETLHLDEQLGSIPYLPGLQVPYYLFVGRKPADP